MELQDHILECQRHPRLVEEGRLGISGERKPRHPRLARNQMQRSSVTAGSEGGSWIPRVLVQPRIEERLFWRWCVDQEETAEGHLRIG